VHLPGCALNKALQTYSSFVDKKAAVLVRYGLNRADDTASGRNQAASSSNNSGGSNGGGSNNNNNDTAADWSHEPTIIPSNLEGMPEVSANRIYRTHSTEQRVNNGSVHVDLGSGAIAVHALPSITALGQSSQGIQGIVSPNQRISSATAYGFGSINRLTDNPYDLGSSNAMPSMTPVLLTRHPSDLVLPQDSHWQENSVAYIWVQATAKGFPCFDREGNWIGSYQYWNVDPSTASLQFAEVGTAVDTNEKTQMESRFKSAKDLKAPEVFENAHDIESTKEKALLFHIKMNLPVLNGILK
jgi:hypothetical protein